MIRECTETDREILGSYLEEDMTIRDIAKQLQISTATIYSVLRRNNIRTNRKINPKIVDKN